MSDLRAIIDLLKSESGIARDWSSPARDASTRKHCLPVLQRVPLSLERVGRIELKSKLAPSVYLRFIEGVISPCLVVQVSQ